MTDKLDPVLPQIINNQKSNLGEFSGSLVVLECDNIWDKVATKCPADVRPVASG